MVEEKNGKKGLEMVKVYSNQKHGLEIIRILSFMTILSDGWFKMQIQVNMEEMVTELVVLEWQVCSGSCIGMTNLQLWYCNNRNIW